MTQPAAVPLLSVPRAARPPLAWWYSIEGLTSLGTNFVMLGIFFYTEQRFGWKLKQNFLLAAAQGLAYIVGALLAKRTTDIVGRGGAVVGAFAAMAASAAAAAAAARQALAVAMILAYSFVSAVAWPVLESLVSTGADAHELSRRIGWYNIVWSAPGVLSVGITGVVLRYWPAGLFLIPAILHTVCALLMAWTSRRAPASQAAAAGHGQPEAQLVRLRTLALWLSRISLPATYVLIYSLMAMMPLLPIMQDLPTTSRTLLGSVWLAARTAAFALLGITVWWHARPRLLLWAAALMLSAFLGTTTRASAIVGPLSLQADCLAMALWQIGLGVALGVIYCGSLYFGMVLSDGSTEHGGYHEALIGLGSVLGPGAGALTQWLWPGSVTAGIAAVALVIGASVAAAATAAIRLRR